MKNLLAAIGVSHRCFFARRMKSTLSRLWLVSVKSRLVVIAYVYIVVNSSRESSGHGCGCYPEVLIQYARLYDVSKRKERLQLFRCGLGRPDQCEFHFSCCLYSVVLNKSFASFISIRIVGIVFKTSFPTNSSILLIIIPTSESLFPISS